MSTEILSLHLLMLVTIFSLFLPKYKNTPLWFFTLPVAITYAIYIGLMSFIGILPLIWLGLSAHATSNENKKIRVAAHISTVITFIAIVGHLVPGFERVVMMDTQSIKPNSVELYFKTSFDIFAATVVFIGKIVKDESFNFSKMAKNLIGLYLITLVVVFPLSLLSGFIGFELEFITQNWSFITLLTFFTMLQLTVFCPMEEAFFRGYFQRGLYSLTPKYKWLQKPIYYWLPLAIPAVIFGLTHLRGGVILAISATIAGLTYGLAYKRTGRLETSILLHYLVNLTHFLFFTYPSLKID